MRCEPARSRDGEFIDRRRRHDLVVAGGDDQHRLADPAGIAGLATVRPSPETRQSAHATVGQPIASDGSASSTATLRA